MQLSAQGEVLFQTSSQIVPAWSNFLPSAAGNVLYYRISQDQLTLSEVRRLFTNENPSLDNFYPSLAVVLTWNNILEVNLQCLCMKVVVNSLNATGNLPDDPLD